MTRPPRKGSIPKPSRTVPDDPRATQRLWRNDKGVVGPEEPLEAPAGLPPFDDAVEENTTAVTKISAISDHPASGTACLVVIYGENLGKRFNLDHPRSKLGRGHRCHIQLDQESVSRNHAEIMLDADGHLLRDLGSTNGTLVNDQQVREHRLRDGDLVKVGRSILKYLSGGNLETAYHEEIYRLTTIDGLTQIYNRRFFLEAMNREISRARRYHRTLSLALFDIDHFKRLNDEHGHLAGDQVLRQMAAVISKRIRREDTLARYGGEEFAVILPEIDRDHTLAVGEKLRRIVEDEQFSSIETSSVTISVGLATFDGDKDDAEALIGKADRALYEAKKAGRNCVRQA